MLLKIKKIIRSFVPERLYTKMYLYRRKKYFGQRFIDFDLRKYLNFKNGFFIEMGAMDGVTYSNTLHLEKYKNWTGILVEPSISEYKLCIKNRTASKVFNFLCSSYENEGKDYLFHDMGAMSYSQFENSDNNYPEHHKNAKNILDKFSKNEKSYIVKTVSISSLLDSTNSPELINFFSLDVEGAEIEVLNGFNFDKYKIQYLLIESRNFSKTKNFLEQYDYVLNKQIDKSNLLFCHKSFM